MSIEHIHAILGENGLLHQKFGQYSPQQLAYALNVFNGFNQDADEHPRLQNTRINMQEGETGTGKTIGYLVPLMLQIAATGERGAVSTYTRHLQNQMIDDGSESGKVGDALLVKEWVAQTTGVHLAIAIRLGQKNYGSLSAVERTKAIVNDDAGLTRELKDDALDFLDGFAEFLSEVDQNNEPCNSGLIEHYLEIAGLEELPFGVTANMISLSSRSPEFEQKAYRRQVSISKAADLLICNHATLILHSRQWGRILDNEERQLAYMVIDEADRLSAAAESIATTMLSLHAMHDVFKSASKAHNAPELQAAMDDLYNHLMRVMPATNQSIPASSIESIVPIVGVLAACTKTVLAKINAQLKDSEKTDLFAISGDMRATYDFANYANDLIDFSNKMTIGGDETAVVSYSPVRHYPSLAIGQANPARLLKRLFQVSDEADYPKRKALKGILFTSATLSTSGGVLPKAFDAFASEIGVIRHALNGDPFPVHNVLTSLYGRFSPAKYGELSFVLPDPAAPSPSIKYDDGSAETNLDWIAYCAAMIRKAHSLGGKVLVLTLSHKDSALLFSMLHDLKPILHSKAQNLSSAVRTYKETDNAILISAAAWEGVDLPGQIQHLVLTRIPYQPPSEFSHVDLIYRAHLKTKNLSMDRISAVLRARATQRTWRKLRQGLGRPIRSRSDCATVWIADPRFPKPASLNDSLDPILMQTTTNYRQQQTFENCIPHRFQVTTWQTPKFFTVAGEIYEIEDIV